MLLVRLAAGDTYRSAAQAVRRLAGRPEAGRPAPAGGQRSLSEGQLAANWVDCFADVVTANGRTLEWPAIVVLDAMAFQVVAGPNAGRRFHVLAAVGRAKRGTAQRVLLFEPAPQKNLAEWKGFLALLAGQPEVVVSDMDAAIGRAVAELFPDAEHRWSEFHLKRSLQNSLPERVLEDDDHPVSKAFEFAFTAPSNYAGFEAAVHAAAASEPGFKAALKWLDRNGPRILAQAQTRTLAGPNSTGGPPAPPTRPDGRRDQRRSRRPELDRTDPNRAHRERRQTSRPTHKRRPARRGIAARATEGDQGQAAHPARRGRPRTSARSTPRRG